MTLEQEFIKRIEKNYKWFKEEAKARGLNDIQTRAIAAYVYELLGQNAEKLKDEAGI